MRHTALILIFVGGATLVLAALMSPSVGAADYTADFLKEAQQRGYGKVTVEYLTMLQESGRLSSDLKDVWDLEMSKSLRIAARNDPFNPKERDEWQKQSKEHLEKFLKDHADHPEVASAQSSFGELALERGLTQVRLSRSTRDKDAKAKHLAEARKSFEEARPRFTDATERYKKRFEDMQEQFEAGKAVKGPAGGRRKKAEEQLEDALLDWLENRFKVALTEFYFATTIEDAKEEKVRNEALTRAAKLFDDIFQENREGLVGVTAHAWHGKCMDEMGKVDDAADIYEEVLASADPSPNEETGLEGLFSQVFYFRAQQEIKKRKHERVSRYRSRLAKDIQGMEKVRWLPGH